MIDWRLVTGFQWDDGNARKSVDKHGVSQPEAEEMFFNEPLLVVEDQLHSQNELRLHALGQTNDQRLLHVTFTLREQHTLIRIISARPMHRKERNFYAKAEKASSAIHDGS